MASDNRLLPTLQPSGNLLSKSIALSACNITLHKSHYLVKASHSCYFQYSDILTGTFSMFLLSCHQQNNSTRAIALKVFYAQRTCTHCNLIHQQTPSQGEGITPDQLKALLDHIAQLVNTAWNDLTSLSLISNQINVRLEGSSRSLRVCLVSIAAASA
jgi:hypothetical protein